MIKEGCETRPPCALAVSSKDKGKATLGLAPALPEVYTPSPLFMEVLMANPTLFEEPLLKDPKEEVTIALGSVHGTSVIKKVLDLLRDSTPFQVAVAVTSCPCIHSLFSPYSCLLLMNFFPVTYGLSCR